MGHETSELAFLAFDFQQQFGVVGKLHSHVWRIEAKKACLFGMEVVWTEPKTCHCGTQTSYRTKMLTVKKEECMELQ